MEAESIRRLFSDGLYCLLGEEFSGGKSNIEVTRHMLTAGVKIIQYREKEQNLRYKYEQCRVIRELTQEAGAMLIVNDDVTIAQAVGADGIHIGQDDIPLREVRKIVGQEMVLGLSTHSPRQAQQAVADGADYIGVGPIYATKTKKNVCAAVGLSYLEYVDAHIPLPYVAIGGIKISNLPEVLNSGAKCVAMVTEILNAPDIGQRIREIKQIIKRR